jgi:hypothetical protein
MTMLSKNFRGGARRRADSTSKIHAITATKNMHCNQYVMALPIQPSIKA